VIHGDRFAVECDRLLDRFRRYGERAELVRVAEHEHVGAERLAEQRGGKPGSIDEMAVRRTGERDDRALEPLDRQRKFGIAGEFAGQHFGEVDDHGGGAGLHGRQHLLVAGDHHVAADHEVGAARRDADRVNVLRLVGEPDVARNGTAHSGQVPPCR